MAFSDFTKVEQVIQLYPLQITRKNFIPDVVFEPPALFIEDVNFSLEKQAMQESEMYFRESFIFPFLQQAWKRHPRLKLWINQALKYDDKLFGEPDYFVSAWAEKEVIDRLVNKPMLAVVETKKQDFEGGWAQCLAELIACQKVNADEHLTVYGIVSTGIIWEFGKLKQNVFTRDPLAYTIAHPQKVLGILDYIFAACEKQLDG